MQLKKVCTQYEGINAEVQFSEAVSVRINSIRDSLGNAGNYIKGAAKNILYR